jgi:hypothetical protein
MRKVDVTLTVNLIINMDEGVEVGDVVNDLDYNFVSQTDGAEVHDMTIADYSAIVKSDG